MATVDVYRALWRHRFLIIGLTLVTGIVVWFLASLQPKVYEATALVRIQQKVTTAGDAFGSLEAGNSTRADLRGDRHHAIHEAPHSLRLPARDLRRGHQLSAKPVRRRRTARDLRPQQVTEGCRPRRERGDAGPAGVRPRYRHAARSGDRRRQGLRCRPTTSRPASSSPLRSRCFSACCSTRPRPGGRVLRGPAARAIRDRARSGARCWRRSRRSPSRRRRRPRSARACSQEGRSVRPRSVPAGGRDGGLGRRSSTPDPVPVDRGCDRRFEHVRRAVPDAAARDRPAAAREREAADRVHERRRRRG